MKMLIAVLAVFAALCLAHGMKKLDCGNLIVDWQTIQSSMVSVKWNSIEDGLTDECRSCKYARCTRK